MDTAFWQGKRVLLTGHTGFKGSWLSLWLQTLGAEVTGLALPPHTDPNLFQLTVAGQPDIKSIMGDIRETDTVADAFARAQPEMVFHLAAQALVRTSYQQPVDTFATNVMGTVNVLERARQTESVRAVIVVTSDKCYQNREWCWAYREDEPLGGHDPYSASKGCAELVTAAYRDSFFKAQHGAGVATARAGNVIGGGDWGTDRLIPDLIRAFSRGEKPLIRRPTAVRPWQHVLEPLAGYLRLAQCLFDEPEAYSEAWNFGPDDTASVTVGTIVEYVTSHWPEAPGWQQDTAAHPHEAYALKVDASKARARLAWNPQLDVRAALDWTVDWYVRHAAGTPALTLVREQLDRYHADRAAKAGPC